MFRGNHPAKVDEKGRLKMPSAFKQLVDAANVTQFYVTSTDGKSGRNLAAARVGKARRAIGRVQHHGRRRSQSTST